jgi:hypothetical protein
MKTLAPVADVGQAGSRLAACGGLATRPESDGLIANRPGER